MIDTLLDFIKNAKHPTLMIIGAVVIVGLGELLFWTETSHKDIKFWGIEITVPESDGIKACRVIQATLHEKLLRLESLRKDTYQLVENNEASIDSFTKLQLAAKVRDEGTYRSDNENVVIGRINDLNHDLETLGKVVNWVEQTEAYDTERVNKECGALIDTRG